MQKYLIKGISVVNEGTITVSDVLLGNGRIEKLAPSISDPAVEINGDGCYLLPGCIDDQVHFREPGLTQKADIASEARAAVAGGVTSYMEMPNTRPPALTQDLLEEKYAIAARNSLANFSFYMGTGNGNADEVLRTYEKRDRVCGIKIFMGSSTGSMLVDDPNTLDRIFRDGGVLIATHCEDERVISRNLEKIRGEKGTLSAADHPLVRDEEACYQSSLYAIQIAKKYDSRLHILHISTARELELFSNMKPLSEKRITAEVCVHHLHFTAEDYGRLGNLIKCNPAIKEAEHRQALWEALLDNRLDVIATDHAPHTWEEKNAPYEQAPAGLPLVQHGLPLMLHYQQQGRISLEKIVDKMSHAVAECFRLRDRGYIREGYWADLVIVDPNKPADVTRENILYKCGWSPLEEFRFPATITHTFVNGNLVYNQGEWNLESRGLRLEFDR